MYLVRVHRLGLPTGSRRSFDMLPQAGLVDRELPQPLVAIVRDIIEHRLTDLATFARRLIASGMQDEPTT